ncbi:MAG: hypothetical protein HYX69_14995 [Planctomycetia bacterium]|nr:hypothetical protein [Planctomycetia bacterium]
MHDERGSAARVSPVHSSFIIHHASLCYPVTPALSREGRGRTGATLLELLAVIIILVLLAGAAIPLIVPALSNRQVREAARIVSTFLNGARNRAMQTGRPVGVVLARVPGLGEACTTLSYAEVPAPYAGDSVTSRAVVQYNASYNPSDPAQNHECNLTSMGSDSGWLNTVRVGDLIKFNYQGHMYRLVGGAPGATDTSNDYYTNPPNTYTWWLKNVTAPPGTQPPPAFANGVPYQIIRAPVKMAAGAVQLPGPAVIDLTCSGFDQQDGLGWSPLSPTWSFQPLWPPVGVDPANKSQYPSPYSGNTYASPFGTSGSPLPDTSSVVITFAPSGQIDMVWCWPNNTSVLAPYSNLVPQATKPLSQVYLMIGRRALLPFSTAPPTVAAANPDSTDFKPYANFQDLGNFWVTINPQTGLIATTEVSAIASGTWSGLSSGSGYWSYNDLMQTRALALSSQRMGGR